MEAERKQEFFTPQLSATRVQRAADRVRASPMWRATASSQCDPGSATAGREWPAAAERHARSDAAKNGGIAVPAALHEQEPRFNFPYRFRARQVLC